MENTGYNFKETKPKQWNSRLSNEHFECRIRRPLGTGLCVAEAKGSYASIQLLPCTVWSWEGYCPNSFVLTSSSFISSFPWYAGHYRDDVSGHAFWPVLGGPLLPPCLCPGPPRVVFSLLLSPAQALPPFPCQLWAHSLSPPPFQSLPPAHSTARELLPPPTAGHQGCSAASWLQERRTQSFHVFLAKKKDVAN